MSKAKAILIMSIVPAVLLAAAIACIVLLTDLPKIVADMFDSEFRVMYGTDKYTGSDNCVILPNASKIEFKVKGCESFSYEILPNADFEYSADGEIYSIAAANVDSVFKAECFVENGGVVFDCDNNNSVPGVLSRLHEGKRIAIPILEQEYPYVLVVKSGDQEIRIAFGFTPKLVTDLTIEPGGVVF